MEPTENIQAEVLQIGMGQPAVTRKPAKRPRGRPPVHGAYSKYNLVPLEQQKIKEISALLAGDKTYIAPTDRITVELLGHVLAQIELIKRWLAENGTIQDEGKGLPQPILPQYFNAIKIAGKLLDQLGLTPEARYRLGRDLVQAEGMAAKIWRAKDE